MYKNRHGVFPMLVSMFGGCSEGQLEHSLGAWVHLVEKQVNEVELVEGAGAWKKFQLVCNF